MKKQPIDLVKKKLDKYPISALTAEELRVYFAHRVEKAAEGKKVITINELNYQLSEAGPGDRRFDPRFIPFLTQEKFFTSSLYKKVNLFEDLLEKKQKVDTYVNENRESENTKKLLLKVLGNYLNDIKVVSNEPFVIDASFNNIPISCIIKNGGWILPNQELFTFLKNIQEQKRFPMVIAKKISGILFPLFKGISILGLNLYKTYLPEQGRNLVKDATFTMERPLTTLEYSDQLQFLSQEYITEIREEHWNGDAIHNFFEYILPKNIDAYYDNFLNTKIKIGDDFIATASQFKKNKGTKGLINSHLAQENLLNSLKS